MRSFSSDRRTIRSSACAMPGHTVLSGGTASARWRAMMTWLVRPVKGGSPRDRFARLGDAGIVQLQDVGMIERRDDGDLAQKPLVLDGAPKLGPEDL